MIKNVKSSTLLSVPQIAPFSKNGNRWFWCCDNNIKPGDKVRFNFQKDTYEGVVLKIGSRFMNTISWKIKITRINGTSIKQENTIMYKNFLKKVNKDVEIFLRTLLFEPIDVKCRRIVQNGVLKIMNKHKDSNVSDIKVLCNKKNSDKQLSVEFKYKYGGKQHASCTSVITN